MSESSPAPLSIPSWWQLEGFMDLTSLPVLQANPPPSPSAVTGPSDANTQQQNIAAIDTYISAAVIGPASEYMRGELSFVAFRAQILAVKGAHMEQLIENEYSNKELLSKAEAGWHDITEVIDDLKPGKILVAAKATKAQLRELEERLGRYESVLPSGELAVEELPFELLEDEKLVSDNSLQGIESDNVGDQLGIGIVDDFHDMREVHNGFEIHDDTDDGVDSEDEDWQTGVDHSLSLLDDWFNSGANGVFSIAHAGGGRYQCVVNEDADSDIGLGDMVWQPS